MKKALTIYIDDDCKFENLMISLTVKKEGKDWYTTTNQLWARADYPDAGDAVYMPYEYKNKDRMKPPLLFDDSNGTEGKEEELNHD